MKNVIVVGGALLLLTFLLFVVPGLDILAWHFLNPTGFWQKIILVAVELLSLWPRIILDIFVAGVGATILSAINEGA